MVFQLDVLRERIYFATPNLHKSYVLMNEWPKLALRQVKLHDWILCHHFPFLFVDIWRHLDLLQVSLAEKTGEGKKSERDL